MTAKERIMGRIKRQVSDRASLAERRANVAARLAAHSQTAPTPSQSRPAADERIEQFCAKVVAADGTASRVASMEDLPEALAAELRGRNLGASIRTGGEPAFAGLDWGQVEVSQGPGRIEEPATLSLASYAMAETGTVALRSGPDNPVTLTFLGETHFVAVRAEDIQDGFEDLWERVRHDGDLPRTVNMVTGPSRSGDIGQVLQLGAHGPVALHVFVVG